ncbi:MAG: hypothetical protein I3J02_11025 [Prevotella sp.]|nr:hypothetical protein [Prevotella sp.]
MEKSLDDYDNHLKCLRLKVEEFIGRTVRTPKDFDFLCHVIEDQKLPRVSSTTLKRIWGYIQDGGSPRISTLDILSQLIGFKDWESFCNSEIAAECHEAEIKAQEAYRISRRSWLGIGLTVGVVLTGLLILFIRVHAGEQYRPMVNEQAILKLVQSEKTKTRVLHRGDSFRDEAAVLETFGIYSVDVPWNMRVPGLANVFVTSVTYHHPNWHNEGDSLEMCPQLKTYWTPDSMHLPKVRREAVLYNRFCYFNYSANNEIHLYFLRGIRDERFTFIGIYKFSKQLSNFDYHTYVRIADNCNLDYLSELNKLGGPQKVRK